MKMNSKIMMASTVAIMGISSVAGITSSNVGSVVYASVYNTVGNNKVEVIKNTSFVDSQGRKQSIIAEKGGSHLIYAVKNMKGETYLSVQKDNQYWLPASAVKGTISYKKGRLTYTISTNDQQTIKPHATAAPTAKTLTLVHNAYVYNSKGKRIKNSLGKYFIKKGTSMSYIGTKKIKGKKYYNLGHGEYIKAGNVDGSTVKPHATVAPTATGATPTDMSKPNLTLSHNAYPYTASGQRMGNYLGFTYIKKNTTINYYGTKKIKGKKYYYIGDGAYIKSGNVGKVRGSVTIKPHATTSPAAEESLSMPRGKNTILLKKNAYPYDAKGKRIYNYLGYTYIKKNTVLNYYGTKKIGGKTYYYIGDNAYVKAANVGKVINE